MQEEQQEKLAGQNEIAGQEKKQEELAGQEELAEQEEQQVNTRRKSPLIMRCPSASPSVPT